MEKKTEKRKAILLLGYIADVSCLTNRPFYMRTLSLIFFLRQVKSYTELANKVANLQRTLKDRCVSDGEPGRDGIKGEIGEQGSKGEPGTSCVG